MVAADSVTNTANVLRSAKTRVNGRFGLVFGHVGLREPTDSTFGIIHHSIAPKMTNGACQFSSHVQFMLLIVPADRIQAAPEHRSTPRTRNTSVPAIRLSGNAILEPH